MNLIDQFKQTWNTSVDNSPKALKYRLCKKWVSFENYLEILKDKDLFLLSPFRNSNHRLPIEIGRCQNINRDNRVCNWCEGIGSWETSFLISSNALNLYRTEPG